MNSSSDNMYKILATSYADSEGARLKSEMEAPDKSGFMYSDSLDCRIERIINNEKKRKKLIKYVPVAAACFIIAFIIFTSRGYLFTEPLSTAPIADTTPSPEYNLAFISARLPDSYYVTNIGYDNGKAIYHIENELKNEILMIAEATGGYINSKGLRAVNIKGTEVYGISKPDYSLLTYEKDNTIYTLTSKYNYLDLIEISEKIIST